jgi:hypothetical protein
MRTIRRFSQVVFTLLGAAIVIFAVYRVTGIYQRVLIAVLGLVVMELGVWQVTRAFFPNEREYRPLREETDYFLKLVRRLNNAALSAGQGVVGAETELEQVHSDMYHSVDRMRRLAGFTAEELGLLPDAPPARPAPRSKVLSA